jgi:precorrin-3B methylase
MDESQIQEAIKVADIVVGFSDYLHKIDYSLDKWMEELNDMMKHIKRQKPPSRKAGSGG